MSIYDEVKGAADAIRTGIAPCQPRIGIVLGSGLGIFADSLEDRAVLPYERIPGFAQSTVSGHAGQLVAGRCGTSEVLVMQGRVHAYEGHALERVVLPVRALIMAGCKTLLITNSAGGINPALEPGDLVLIRDHLNLSGQNPLKGENDDRLGPRFPDMSEAYDRDLRILAVHAAARVGYVLREGIYSYMLGPSYETPAEIRMARLAGADLAGMSTVPEVIAARHMGARVLGLSCVTNKAAGLQGTLSHEEVKETASRVRDTFVTLLTAIVQDLRT